MLNPRQQRFVQEYLVDLNATQAAIRAGYSAKTASVIGYENLSKPQIAEAIESGKAKLTQRVEITQEMVLRGLLSETTAADATPSSRNTAWKALGQAVGLFDGKRSGDPDARTLDDLVNEAAGAVAARKASGHDEETKH